MQTLSTIGGAIANNASGVLSGRYGSTSAWVETYDGPQFDIIFVDPPYHDVQFSTAILLMGLLKPSALMVLSHPGRSECPTRPGVVVVDNRSYGDATLTLFRREK